MFVVSQGIPIKRRFNIQTEQSNAQSKSSLAEIPISIQSNLSLTQINEKTKERPFIPQYQQQALSSMAIKRKKIRFCLSIIKEQAKGERNSSKKQHKLNKKKQKRRCKDEKYQSGRWKEEEHQRFVDAIIKYGNDWKQVQTCVKTRSSTQARSHAQKFFIKLKCANLFDFELDLTKNSIKLLHNLLKLKSEEEYEEIKQQLNQIAFEKRYSCLKNKPNDDKSASDNNDNYSRKNTDTITDLDLNAQYILSTFLNNLTDDNYNSDQRINSAFQERTISIDYNNNDYNYNEKIRPSIGSINEYFKNSIEDKEIKDLHFGNNNSLNNKDYALNFNHFFNQKRKDSNDKFIIPSNNNSRKVSQDEDYFLSYAKYNINNN